MTPTEKRYRYPGVRPFESDQERIFFGRKEDTERLLSMILQERLCVVFGKSGHGKSSLLNAGIIPALLQKGGRGKREYIPISVRFNAWAGPASPPLFEKFLFHLNSALAGKAPPAGDIPPNLPNTIWGAIKRWNPGKNIGFVLIFDQFEEFFTYPEEQQNAFKDQLNELLYADFPQYLEMHEDSLSASQFAHLVEKADNRAVFSIRSDRLSDLDKLKDRLPAILLKRFELQALDEAQATESIVAPAADGLDGKTPGADDYASPAFRYEPSALNRILAELQGREGASSDRVEAFLLQIVCTSIEKKVAERRLGTVTEADLPDFNTIFDDYYEDRISELAPADQPLARWVLEQGLLLVDQQTGEPRRLSRDAGELAQALGVSPELLRNLERTYLVRREVNSLGGYNYELSHDVLIRPIMRLRKQRESEELAQKLERERLEAETKAREAAEMARLEHERAEEAERLKQQAERGRRQARFFSLLASGVAVLALVALGFAWQKHREASALNEELKITLADLEAKETERQKVERDKVWQEVEQLLAKARELRKRAASDEATRYQQKAHELVKEYPDNPFLQDKWANSPDK